jgi:1-acyl-sn-glycerol-3-phosphate acyltransferase
VSPSNKPARRPGPILSYRRGRKAPVVAFVKILAKVFMPAFFSLRSQGVENLPGQGPFVLLPKHQRWEDIPLLGLTASCPLYYVAKQELFDRPLSKWLITSLGGIPLNRQRPMESRHAIRCLQGLLEEGKRIVIFPEGTYFRGRMGAGQVGLLRLLRSRMRLAYIPVGIRYGEGKGRRIVEIRFGRAISEDPSLPVEAFLERIMGEIARLSGFLQPPPKVTGLVSRSTRCLNQGN